MKSSVTDKKQRVFDTTLNMILQNGIQSASMGKISKQSGVAIGTIYHHFESKEQLITELYKRIKLKLISAFNNFKSGENMKDNFHRFMYKYIDFAIKNPKEFEFISRFYKSPVINKDVMNEMEDAFFNINPSMSDFYTKNEIIKNVDMQVILTFINGALTQALRSYSDGDLAMTKQDWNNYIEMLWNGITK